MNDTDYGRLADDGCPNLERMEENWDEPDTGGLQRCEECGESMSREEAYEGKCENCRLLEAMLAW